MRTDEELMAAYRDGDAAAFRELFARYSALLYRMMLRDLRRPEEARDLVQQTFLQLHRARHDFDTRQRLRPWIFTIAMNLKREHFRRVKRRPEGPLDAEVADEVLDAGGGARIEASRTLRVALAELPADQREVIELHWFEGLAFSEVAEVVGASLSAVKVRAHRGYVRLRELLGADSFAPGGEPPDRNQEP